MRVSALVFASLLSLSLATGGCKKHSAAATPPAPSPSGELANAPASAPASAVPPLGVLPTAPLSFAPIAKRADPSVVFIETFSDGGRGAKRRIQNGIGSGFIIDKDGLVLTNNHVIDGGDVISVKLSDERKFTAEIVGRDARTDVAVLRIKGKNLTPVPLGDSDASDTGDWVVAIGNPFGLSHTVSVGIVSAKGRTRDDVPLDPAGYYDFLQTDASINPGNSGGPLFNLKGEVIGINTAIRGKAQGIGFAIPINMVKQLLPMLLREGRITRSALGIHIRDVRELSDEERANMHIGEDRGAMVDHVRPGSAAAKAHLEAGDVIVKFEGQLIDRATRLQWLASVAGVGKAVSMTVSRSGKQLDVRATLGELEEAKKEEAPAKGPARRDPDDDDDDRR